MVIAITGADTPVLSEQEAASATLEATTIAHELGLADDLPGSVDRHMIAATTVAELTSFPLDADVEWVPSATLHGAGVSP